MKTRKKCIRRVVALATAIVIISAIAASGTAMGKTPDFPPNSPELYVLIVGISDYQGTENDNLRKASVTDTTEFYWRLKNDWPLARIKLLKDKEATEYWIDFAFGHTFAGAGPDDVAIVCWSGHSGESDDYDRALMTYDLQPYAPSKLAEKLSKINAGTIIVIIDSCYAGVYEQELDVGGQIVLMSSRADETVYGHTCRDPLPSYHNFFLYWLNRIPESADTNDNGWLSIEEVFAYASDRTVESAASCGRSQHPVMVDNCQGEVNFYQKFSAFYFFIRG